MTDRGKKIAEIRRGDIVKVNNVFGMITSIQQVHNRYQLYGVSGWQYGLEKIEKSNVESLLEELSLYQGTTLDEAVKLLKRHNQDRQKLIDGLRQVNSMGVPYRIQRYIHSILEEIGETDT